MFHANFVTNTLAAIRTTKEWITLTYTALYALAAVPAIVGTSVFTTVVTQEASHTLAHALCARSMACEEQRVCGVSQSWCVNHLFFLFLFCFIDTTKARITEEEKKRK
jgi:hypothetical protein